jgi:hypothetical protein
VPGYASVNFNVGAKSSAASHPPPPLPAPAAFVATPRHTSSRISCLLHNGHGRAEGRWLASLWATVTYGLLILMNKRSREVTRGKPRRKKGGAARGVSPTLAWFMPRASERKSECWAGGWLGGWVGAVGWERVTRQCWPRCIAINPWAWRVKSAFSSLSVFFSEPGSYLGAPPSPSFSLQPHSSPTLAPHQPHSSPTPEAKALLATSRHPRRCECVCRIRLRLAIPSFLLFSRLSAVSFHLPALVFNALCSLTPSRASRGVSASSFRRGG